MSKRKHIREQSNTGKEPSRVQLPGNQGPAWLQNTALHKWVIFLFGFLLYANTLTHDYTQDDAIVIYDNMFTTQGVKGIPGILKYDTFYGFFKEEGKANLVAGGRYRPFTLVMFALEWQLFGRSPFAGHLINVLLFCLCSLVLYQLLLRFFDFRNQPLQAGFLALGTTLLFAAHPVHTEVVANIKGRDEIMALLGSLLAAWCCLKAWYSERYAWNIVGAICFFIALMSKENAITFLVVIPLTFWFFTKANLPKIALHSAPLFASAILFLLIRGSVIGWSMGDEPMELMNNPFIKVDGARYIPFTMEERLATILFTLGKYLQLLVFPHPLTHDYYPRHIDIMHFTDWRVLLSLLLYVGLAIWAIRGMFKKDRLSYGILFYLVTLSIVSNFLFPVGTNMSERFLFMPSVGFCIAVTMLCWRWGHAGSGQHFGGAKGNIIVAAFAIVLVAFGLKTITRNTVWKDNYSLFTTDVKTSVNSAKLQNAAAGEKINRAASLKDESLRIRLLQEAVGHLQAAIRIHPNYKNAHLLLGNAYNYLKDYELSIQSYQRALQLDPDYPDALNNLSITYRDAGRFYGEQKGDLPKALDYLQKAHELKPSDYETLRLLGVAYGVARNNEKAVEFFSKALEIAPDNPDALYNLGSAYHNAGDAVKGMEFHQKAIQIDPEVAKRMQGKQ